MAATKKGTKKAPLQKRATTKTSRPMFTANPQAMRILWLVLLFTLLSVVFAMMSYWRYHV